MKLKQINELVDCYMIGISVMKELTVFNLQIKILVSHTALFNFPLLIQRKKYWKDNSKVCLR